MKKILLLMIVLIILFSCSNKTPKENIFEPKQEMKQILDSFVQENIQNDYRVYELYIDKLDPDNYNMILYAGNVSLTELENNLHEQQSMASVVSYGVKINIYSGVEHYFKSTNSVKVDHLQKKSNNDERTLLAIKDSAGFLTTYEIGAGYPFIPLPLENRDDTFTLPTLQITQ